MNTARAGWVGVVYGGLFLALAAATVLWGHRYRVLAARVSGAAELSVLADSLHATADRMRTEPVDSSSPPPAGEPVGKRAAWQIVDAEARFDPPVDDPALTDGVTRAAADQASIFGPVTSQTGEDMLIIRRSPAAGPSGIPVQTGLVFPVIDLMRAAGILEFAKTGHRVRISWADQPAADIFVSHLQSMKDPVVTRVAMAGGEWAISAEPVAGWVPLDDVWPLALWSVLIAFLIGAASFLMARKPQELRLEMDMLEQHLKANQEDLASSLQRHAQIERRLQAVTTFDAESGLPNRPAFEQMIADELKSVRAKVGSGLSVAVLRLENLRRVVGVVGAASFFSRLGEVLAGVRGVTGVPINARISDIELALCLPGQTEPEVLAATAEQLCASLSNDFTADGEVFDLGPSVGIAIAEDGYQYPDDLLQGATLAATEAHTDGIRKWAIYDPRIREQQTTLLQLESQIGRAIDEHQFRLYCQPIVSTSDRSLKGFETLLRWQHPLEGLLTPHRFLDIAEGSRHMPRLSQWCVDEVTRMAGEWVGLREEPFYLSVNLMASDLERSGFVAGFAAQIRECALPPECLRVEVTEREIIKDLAKTSRATADLEDQGVHVLLDDFGTGFSSLTHLRAFRFHTVKIDRSFIVSMVEDPKDFALVKAIIDLVHELGMQCVAEGVETEEQLGLLQQMGCDFCQGYLFSRPVPPSQVPELVARFRSPVRVAG